MLDSGPIGLDLLEDFIPVFVEEAQCRIDLRQRQAGMLLANLLGRHRLPFELDHDILYSDAMPVDARAPSPQTPGVRTM
jgi:hypothetical protein